MGVILSDFFNNNWLSIIFWISSIFITWWFGAYYFRRKKISVYSRGNRVIGYDENLKAEVRDNLEITYCGVAIPRLTRTIYVLWSSGSSSVSREDIASKDALRIIKSDDGEIISARILKTNNESSEFQVSLCKDNSFVEIDFDYLQPKNGAVFEVLHTSSNSNLDFKGSFRSDGTIEVNSKYEPRTTIFPTYFYRSRVVKQIIPSLIFSFGFVGLLAVIFGTLSIINPQLFDQIVPQIPSTKNDLSGIFTKIMIIILGITYTSLPITYIREQVKKYPKSLATEA